MKKAIQKMRIMLLLTAMLFPLLSFGQQYVRTERGDFNEDGLITIDDVTAITNYLLTN